MQIETLQVISLMIGIPSALFSLLVMISKSFRDWVFNKKNIEKAKANEEEDRRETDRCLLRNHITSIYFRHCEEKTIMEWEYENLTRLYTQYKKLGGNSFVDKIWNEVQSWKVIRK